MTTTWGLLPKSQIDSETIEEMVDRKISEHEEDSESHLGVGESIDVHRKSEIVDHLAGSVLSDKNTMTEFDYHNDFDDINNYFIGGEVDVTSENSVRLYIEEGATNISKLYKEFLRPSPFMTTGKDFLMQELLQFDLSSVDFLFLAGVSFGNAGTDDFIGFKYIDGNVRGYIKDGAYTAETGNMSVTLSNANIFRVQYVAGENKIYFYINGQVAGQLTRDIINWASDGGPLFLLEEDGSVDGYVYIKDLHVTRSVI